MAENEITIYTPIDKEKVKTQIFEIRGYKVMLDKDIAEYFGVTTGNLNKAMKRNIKRFPQNFCFQISRDEYKEILRFQSGSLELEQGQYSKYPPYVYTEQGVAMLTSALHTDRAIEASVQIVEAFVEMSHYIRQNRQFLPYDELKRLELKHYQLSDRVQNIEENMLTRADLDKWICWNDVIVILYSMWYRKQGDARKGKKSTVFRKRIYELEGKDENRYFGGRRNSRCNGVYGQSYG